jgi:hypothetical protein
MPVSTFNFISAPAQCCVPLLHLHHEILLHSADDIGRHIQSINHLLSILNRTCAFCVLASTVLTAAVAPEGPVHSLWALPARLHPSLCGEIIYFLYSTKSKGISILTISWPLKEFCLLGRDAVWLLYEPAFRRNVLAPLSWWKESARYNI